MKWIHNDGARKAAGYKGTCGDCVCRSVAIATGKPYQEVYDALKLLAGKERPRCGSKKSSVRDGCSRATLKRYMASIGWDWTPTMFVGQGCKVHLHDGELPMGRLVVSVSKHLTAVIDGVIHDTYDPQREVHELVNGKPTGHVSRRCVYGYFKQKAMLKEQQKS